MRCKKVKVGTRCCASTTAKSNTDAEHRVPTKLGLYLKWDCFTAPPPGRRFLSSHQLTRRIWVKRCKKLD